MKCPRGSDMIVSISGSSKSGKTVLVSKRSPDGAHRNASLACRNAAPDFASLHPGYGVIRLRLRPCQSVGFQLVCFAHEPITRP
jgi:hypothetical protein